VALEATPDNEAQSTLGGLLYADPTRHRVAESEWAALVRTVAQGDQLALRTLYERMHRLVFTLALRLTGSRETADEVTVDVFFQVWQRAGTYDPAIGPVVAWVMNLARSRSIDRLRHEQRAKRTSADGANGVDPTHDAFVADDSVAALDLQADTARLRLALAQLPALEREVLEAAFFRDLSYSEVAAQFGEPLGTVKTRIRAGLARLRKVLPAWSRP
jgi:RNA polymerase sigma-70 factor, ECF subfamily